MECKFKTPKNQKKKKKTKKKKKVVKHNHTKSKQCNILAKVMKTAK